MKTKFSYLICLWLLAATWAPALYGQTTLHGTYKAVTIPMDKNVPYSKTLILLHEIHNGSNLANNYMVGHIMAVRGSANALHRLNVVQITSGAAYISSRGFRASISTVGYNTIDWKLKTCTYNGKRYIALDVPYEIQQHSQGYHFVGWTLSTGESLKTVTYEIKGTPQNQNLLSDVQDFSPNMYAQHHVRQFTVTGNVGIGTNDPQAKLAVNGNILAKEVKVKTDISVPDYVFAPEYELPALAEVEAYVKEHRHLPEIPSAKDIKKDGLDLAGMNLLLLKKVEELTLHVIGLKKENEEQAAAMRKLKADLTSIQFSVLLLDKREYQL